MAEIGTFGADLTLNIRQGATFGAYVTTVRNKNTGLPIDITGWIIRGQVRKTPDSNISTGAVITAEVLNGTQGLFRFFITDEQTSLLVADPNSATAAASLYVYDMEAERPDGSVIPIIYGQAKVWREVTKTP